MHSCSLNLRHFCQALRRSSNSLTIKWARISNLKLSRMLARRLQWFSKSPGRHKTLKYLCLQTKSNIRQKPSKITALTLGLPVMLRISNSSKMSKTSQICRKLVTWTLQQLHSPRLRPNSPSVKSKRSRRKNSSKVPRFKTKLLHSFSKTKLTYIVQVYLLSPEVRQLLPIL